MSPDDLADKHPRLYHVTSPSALEGIRSRGLLSTSDLLALFEVSLEDRRLIEKRRRPDAVTIFHPIHGSATITDNQPLSEKALMGCLENGLAPEDWLALLNKRVFFWPDIRSFETLLGAKRNKERERLVLVFDTRSLVARHAARVELAAINTGSTIMNPARRGLSTFVPLGAHTYRDFRQLRRKNSNLREVTVIGSVPDAWEFVVDSMRVGSQH